MCCPDEFFEELTNIPEEQKKFIIQQRKRTRERFAELDRIQDQVEEKIQIVPSNKKNKASPVVHATPSAKKPPDTKRERKAPPAHLRCLAKKSRKKKGGGYEQCKRYNQTSEEQLCCTSFRTFC